MCRMVRNICTVRYIWYTDNLLENKHFNCLLAVQHAWLTKVYRQWPSHSPVHTEISAMQDPASFGLHARLEPIQAIKAHISCISPVAMAVSLQTILIKSTAMDTSDMSNMTSWLHHVIGMHTHLLLIARQIRFTLTASLPLSQALPRLSACMSLAC